MKPTREELNQVIETSYDDDDLCENFQWFCEDHVSLDDEAAFVASVKALPLIMRRLYLVLHADTVISGGGFPSYFEPSRATSFYHEVTEGFRLIGKSDLATIFSSGISYLAARNDTGASVVSMNEETDGVHTRYFADHKDIPEKIGQFVRKNKRRILNEKLA